MSNRIIVYTDASLKHHKGLAGCLFEEQKEVNILSRKTKCIQELELFAIAIALVRIAELYKASKERGEKIEEVRIISDSTDALTQIQRNLSLTKEQPESKKRTNEREYSKKTTIDTHQQQKISSSQKRRNKNQSTKNERLTSKRKDILFKIFYYFSQMLDVSFNFIEVAAHRDKSQSINCIRNNEIDAYLGETHEEGTSPTAKASGYSVRYPFIIEETTQPIQQKEIVYKQENISFHFLHSHQMNVICKNKKPIAQKYPNNHERV